MFASLFHASAGDDRSPWGDFWFSPAGGGRTAAGQRVNADTAMQLAAVFACTRVLSEAMGVLPFRLYQPKVGGGRQRVTKHWLLTLLARRPNQFQNWFEWRTMMQGHLALRGNGYNVIAADGAGGISSLLPVHPDRIKAEPLDNGSWRYCRTLPDGTQQILKRQEVWHLRSLSNDGICGISPIEVEREVIGGALGVQDYGNRFFANDAKPTGGWLEIPGTIANDATRDKLKEQAQKAVSGSNRHKVLVLDRGMKYHEVGLTNKDSQFLELRKYSRSEICGIFRVPPHMIADLERATFSNIEQQGIDFWQNTMLPWVTLWEAAARDLLGDDSDLEPQFDFTAMLRGDSAARAQYLHNLVLDGILTRNEAREMEGFDPIAGLEEPLVPVNERGLNDPAPTAPGAPPAADPTEPDEDDAPAPKKKGAAAADLALLGRLGALVKGGAERMARRIAAGDVPPAAALAAALGIEEQLAIEWLAGNPGATTWQVEIITASLRALGGLK